MSSKYELLSVVGDARQSGDRPSRSPVYATSQFIDSKTLPDSEATCYYNFSTAVQKFGDFDCLGAREVGEDGEVGPYRFWNYRETAQRVEYVASAMKAVGVKRGNKVGVFGVNCREWMLAMQGCNRMSFVCVPIYDTFGEDAVEFIINHSESCIVFVDGVNLPKLEKSMHNIKQNLKTVVYWGKKEEASIKALQDGGIAVYTMDAFSELGKENPAAEDPPIYTDVCTIMYTSGTTGDPKGVMLTHKAVASEVLASKIFVDKLYPMKPGDRFISYLPLAHIFDRMTEELMLVVGGSIGYWQGNILNLVADITALKPSFFVGVPRVFDRIYTRVMHGVESASFLKKFLFKWGFRRKSQALKDGIPHAKASPFFDKLVFSKVKERLGGEVRLILSGGAPIAAHTEEFLKVCFCTDVGQGYGLTETCAGTFITYPDDPDMNGTVGPPMPFVEFCLESVPDMNYDANANPPIGEVCVRTPASFSGYYKEKKMTDEVLDSDGWFHTGDVGTITSKGVLKLVDRKKNILKLSQGEYVAVEKVEGVFKESTAVEQIWVHGDSFQNFLVAIVVPTEEYVKTWAQAQSKAYDYATLCKDEELVKEMLSILTNKGRAQNLKGFEIVKKIALESEQFSVDNDLLTPTFKLKRPQLKKKYEDVISELYQA